MTSGADMSLNLTVCTDQIRRAAAAGCRLIATPENTARMTATTQQKKTTTTEGSEGTNSNTDSTAAITVTTPSPETHPVLLAMQSLAQELNIYILIGSIAVRVEGETRVANRSYLVGPTKSTSSDLASLASSPSSSPTGSILGAYDKIHMFDVPSLNGAETYLESSRILPGSTATLVELNDLCAGTQIGMTICYDLRFPQLYRSLAQAGANILTVPSAFTVVTGEAHWHTLLRSRAIETGCYILAPAQSGTHPGERRTYGHSLIVSPWGEILADAGTISPGFITTEIDLEQCQDARRRIPSLTHDRPFTIVKANYNKTEENPSASASSSV